MPTSLVAHPDVNNCIIHTTGLNLRVMSPHPEISPSA